MGCRENDGPANIKGHEFFGKINWQHLEAGKAEPPFPPDVSANCFISLFNQSLHKNKIIRMEFVCLFVLFVLLVDE